MTIKNATSFLAFGAIVAFALYYIADLGVRLGPPDDRVNVSMQVPDTNSLVVDSNVLLRGVPVGKVTAVSSSVQDATVDFYVDSRFQIPVDTEVKLENLSALGESYILLKPRSEAGPTLQDGQRVLTEDIIAPASISELSTNMVRVLNQMEPGGLGRLIDEVDRALPPTDGVLPNLNRASLLLRDTVHSMDGRGAQVLSNLQTLLQNAGWVGPSLAQSSPHLLNTAQPLNDIFAAFLAIAGGSGAPESIRRVGALLTRVNNFLNERSPDLKVIGQSLLPNVQGIAGALMNVDTGRMLSNVLNGIPEDGVITLRLRVDNP